MMALLCVMSLVGCGGNVKNVKITEYTSEKYSNDEIKDAIDVAIDYFAK